MLIKNYIYEIVLNHWGTDKDRDSIVDGNSP
jgi:hypothetical protein